MSHSQIQSMLSKSGLSPKSDYAFPNAPIQQVNELRLLPSLSRINYEKIKPYLIALPANTPINLNTAPKEVLAFIAPDLSMQQIESVIEARNAELGFPSQDAALTALGLDVKTRQNLKVSLKSQYYLVDTEVKTGDLLVRRISLLKRQDQKDRIVLQRIWRSSAR